MLLTKKDLAQRDKYKTAQPKQRGNLHERMKLVVEICNDRKVWKDIALWRAISDLEAEVSMYAPAEPPFGE